MSEISRENPYTTKYDLTNCDKEPIHIIQTVQSFAAILAVDLSDWHIRQTSSNISEFIKKDINQILGKPLSDLLPNFIIERLKNGIEIQDFSEINPIVLPFDDEIAAGTILIAHQKGEQLIIEVEEVEEIENELSFLNRVDKAILKIQAKKEMKNLLRTLVKEVKGIIGYERVMIYKFDKDYNGAIIAEHKEEHLESFWGLNYPSTDIPKQARELFLTNRVRTIADVNDNVSMIQPPLHPVTQQPLNVGSSAARGVSPIHLEYLRNMGVRASLSVAIVEHGKLWGLIACHHYSEKKALSYRTRTLLKFMGQIFSGHLALFRANEFRENLLMKNKVHAQIFTQLDEHKDLIHGLTKEKFTILDYIKSTGAAIVYEDKISTIGITPTDDEIQKLINYLSEHDEDLVFSTDNLQSIFQEYSNLTKNFAGLLSIKLTADPAEYILWFRAPKTKEIFWGGNPEKAINKQNPKVRLSPRKSFEKWKQVVKGSADSWEKHEMDAAILLRNDIKEIFLKRFQELKKLNHDLKSSYEELESFSYSVSHDLRSPLRAIEGFGQILLEDYADKLDEYGLSVINTIVENINRMNKFVDDILRLSKLAKIKLIYNEVDVTNMLPQIIKDFKNATPDYQKVEIIIGNNLPIIHGDYTMIYQLFSNLVGNALKYSVVKENPKVEIVGKIENSHIVYYVKDNGIGMDNNYIHKIFEVFSRLVSEDEFEGTGIGLSIVKRIIERHQGIINVESELGKGTTFEVSFPKIDNEQFAP